VTCPLKTCMWTSRAMGSVHAVGGVPVDGGGGGAAAQAERTAAKMSSGLCLSTFTGTCCRTSARDATESDPSLAPTRSRFLRGHRYRSLNVPRYE